MSATRNASTKTSRSRAIDHHLIKRVKSEVGAGLAVIEQVKREAKNNPRLQAQMFFDLFSIPSATGRRRIVSVKTLINYRRTFAQFLTTLKQLNINLRNMDEFTAKHVRLATQEWEVRQETASSLQNKNTHLRRMAVWLGKPTAVPVVRELLLNPDNATRHLSATTSKTWEFKGIDPMEVIRKVAADDYVDGLRLELLLAFGLRVREVICLKPHTAFLQDASEGQAMLYAHDGTKGGKPRFIPVQTDQQRDLLARASEVSRKTASGLLTTNAVASHLSLEKQYRAFNNAMAKAGISKSGLGVTLHGLRHTYANQRYEAIAGAPSAIAGGVRIAPELDLLARQKVSEELGHHRVSVTSAYLGSHRTIAAHEKNAIQRLLSKLEGSSAILAIVAHIHAALGRSLEWFVVGGHASGKARPGETLVICFQPSTTPDGQPVPIPQNNKLELGGAVGAAIGVMTVVIPLDDLPDKTVDKLALLKWDHTETADSATHEQSDAQEEGV